MTGVPKLILVPDTVPTIALPRLEFGISWKAITTLLLVESYSATIVPVLPALNTDSLPKLILVPDTVPTIAVP